MWAKAQHSNIRPCSARRLLGAERRSAKLSEGGQEHRRGSKYLELLVLLLDEADESVAPPLQLRRVSALEEPVEPELPRLQIHMSTRHKSEKKREGRGGVVELVLMLLFIQYNT